MPKIDLEKLDLPKQYLEQLQLLLKKYVPDAEIWAYGSRVTGTAHEGSDLDIILRNPKDLNKDIDGWIDLKEAITESTIPIIIDLHLWNMLPVSFHDNIQKAYCVLQKSEQNNVPTLRFPEFGDTWEEKKLADVSNVNPKSDQLPYTFNYIDLEAVVSGELIKLQNIHKEVAPSRAQRVLKRNDILFQMVRPYQQNNFFFELDDGYVASTGYAQIRFSGYPQYLYHYLYFKKFVDNVINRCTGTSYPAINSSDLKNIPIHIPSLPEQQKISDFLSVVDEKISQLQKEKSLLEHYKKGIMQKIFKQEIRFKDDNGQDFPDWEMNKMGDVVQQVIREIPKPKSNYLALGMRSHAKGLFHKPDSDPSKIAMDKLYIVHENDLVVNITFAWEGAIGVAAGHDHGGLVSHRFPTYVCKAHKISIEFLRYIVTTKKFILSLDLISPGGAGRNRVLSKKDFLKLKINLPTPPEQQKIAEFLSEIDAKIAFTSKELTLVQNFKKGLLQKMFI